MTGTRRGNLGHSEMEHLSIVESFGDQVMYVTFLQDHRHFYLLQPFPCKCKVGLVLFSYKNRFKTRLRKLL